MLAAGRTPPVESSMCPRSVALVDAWAAAKTEEGGSRTKPARTALRALGENMCEYSRRRTPTNLRKDTQFGRGKPRAVPTFRQVAEGRGRHITNDIDEPHIINRVVRCRAGARL